MTTFTLVVMLIAQKNNIELTNTFSQNFSTLERCLHSEQIVLSEFKKFNTNRKIKTKCIELE